MRTLYDPACGTDGMLSVAQGHLHELNPDAVLEVFQIPTHNPPAKNSSVHRHVFQGP